MGSSKGKKTRPRPVINIDVNSIKSDSYKRKSIQSVDLNKMKQPPNVAVENEDSGSYGAGSSNLTGNEVDLQPLKPDVPPPFGITVVQE